MQVAATVQTNPPYFPEGSATFINPTGREFQDGVSAIARWNVKVNGAFSMPARDSSHPKVLDSAPLISLDSPSSGR